MEFVRYLVYQTFPLGNFAFASDGTQPLVDKGQVMARQQFIISDYQFAKPAVPGGV